MRAVTVLRDLGASRGGCRWPRSSVSTMTARQNQLKVQRQCSECQSRERRVQYWLALLWHFCFSDFYEEPFTMGASQGWRAFEEIENGLPDGGHAGLGWRSYDSFFSVPLL